MCYSATRVVGIHEKKALLLCCSISCLMHHGSLLDFVSFLEGMNCSGSCFLPTLLCFCFSSSDLQLQEPNLSFDKIKMCLFVVLLMYLLVSLPQQLEKAEAQRRVINSTLDPVSGGNKSHSDGGGNSVSFGGPEHKVSSDQQPSKSSLQGTGPPMSWGLVS